MSDVFHEPINDDNVLHSRRVDTSRQTPSKKQIKDFTLPSRSGLVTMDEKI